MADAQNFKNHRKFVPAFHFVLMPILLLNFLFMAYHVWQNPGHVHGVERAHGVRLDHGGALRPRLRHDGAGSRHPLGGTAVLPAQPPPADLKAGSPSSPRIKPIGLRFASDAELPELAATVLRDNIKNRDAIKKMVKNWRADDLKSPIPEGGGLETWVLRPGPLKPLSP